MGITGAASSLPRSAFIGRSQERARPRRGTVRPAVALLAGPEAHCRHLGVRAYEPPIGAWWTATPYAVLATHSARYVVDAGRNTLLRVRRGEITTVAVFPARPKPVLDPPLPGPPFFESVPDSIVRGPGGDLFSQVAERRSE